MTGGFAYDVKQDPAGFFGLRVNSFQMSQIKNAGGARMGTITYYKDPDEEIHFDIWQDRLLKDGFYLLSSKITTGSVGQPC